MPDIDPTMLVMSQTFARLEGVTLTARDDLGCASKYSAECHNCVNRRSIPGDAHIRCANPPAMMTGSTHGMSHGWFMFPTNFDPCWRTSPCANFQRQEE